MTTIAATGIDHVGIVADDLDALEATFAGLGFAVAPRCALLRPAGEGFEPMDQLNHHLLLENGYIELTAMSRRSESHHLAPLIDRYPGLHILALATVSAEASRRALASRGLAPGEVSGAAREITYPGARGTARFKWFRVPEADAPEAFVCYCEHLTPELVKRRDLAVHANGVRRLAGMTLCVDDLDAAAGRYARLLGAVPRRGEGTAVFELAPGRLELTDRRALARRFPGAGPPVLPWAAALTLEVADFGETAGFLRRAGIDLADTGIGAAWIPAAAAAGVILELAPPAGA